MSKQKKILAGNISIVAIGPLTNIALAMTINETVMKDVNRIYIMGGSVSGIGNIWPGIEFNFAADPESAHIVLNSSAVAQSVVFPFDTVLKVEITKVL